MQGFTREAGANGLIITKNRIKTDLRKLYAFVHLNNISIHECK